MLRYVRLKTTRTRNGYANAKLRRYISPINERLSYSIQFYNDYLIFKHHEDLRKHILSRYGCDIGTKKDFWGI